MGSSENPAPHHETPTFGNPDLPPEGMENTTSFNISPRRQQRGGWVREVTQADFAISDEIAGGDPREVPARRAGNRAAAIAGGVP